MAFMIRAAALTCGLLILLANVAAGTAAVRSAKALSTENIVECNVSARRGLEAWQALTTLATAGTLYTGKQGNAELPIVVKLKRPNKSRLEIDVQGHRMVQTFDGKNGWTIRRLRGQDIVAPYGPDEVAFSRAWDGFAAPPLIDHARRAIRVELDGTEAVDGTPAYRVTFGPTTASSTFGWTPRAFAMSSTPKPCGATPARPSRSRRITASTGPLRA